MPGEVSRSFDPCPDPQPQELRDAIVYDVDVTAGYDAETLKGEIRRLRNLLNECWEAAGLLGPQMTGQPYQAWEEPSDLVMRIDDLHADADEHRFCEQWEQEGDSPPDEQAS